MPAKRVRGKGFGNAADGKPLDGGFAQTRQ